MRLTAAVDSITDVWAQTFNILVNIIFVEIAIDACIRNQRQDLFFIQVYNLLMASIPRLVIWGILISIFYEKLTLRV